MERRKTCLRRWRRTTRAAGSIDGYLKPQWPSISIHVLRGYEHDMASQCDESDIVLLDMHLIPRSGPAICRRLRAINDHAPVLGMTCFAMEHYLDEITATGARGPMQKEQPVSMPKLVGLLVHGGMMGGFRTARDPHAANRTGAGPDGEGHCFRIPRPASSRPRNVRPPLNGR